MPCDAQLKEEIFDQAHRSRFSIHPGGTKMYRDLMRMYWWKGMKREVAEYVARCYTCQQVKGEHQRPAGPLQPLPVAEWKWDHITMDFMSGLPRMSKGQNLVWVIMDCSTKAVHFLAVKTTGPLTTLSRRYI